MIRDFIKNITEPKIVIMNFLIQLFIYVLCVFEIIAENAACRILLSKLGLIQGLYSLKYPSLSIIVNGIGLNDTSKYMPMEKKQVKDK